MNINEKLVYLVESNRKVIGSISEYRIPKYKETLRAFGYMENPHEDIKSPNITTHEDDNKNWIALHHRNTEWHILHKNNHFSGKGMHKLKEKLLELYGKTSIPD
jgi:hypothetical protein